MRVLIWVTENSWEGCVDHARALLAGDARVQLVHVAPSDVEELVARGPARLLGRRPPPSGQPPRAIADEEAHALLEAARTRLGREAELTARRGRVERELLDACAGADLLIMARDGEHRPGPASLGPRGRFVLDHAPCQVLLVWEGEPPAVETSVQSRPRSG